MALVAGWKGYLQRIGRTVGYRVKSFQGTRFRQWATRILREMLLNKLDEVKRIANLERRMDAAEGDIKQIKGE